MRQFISILTLAFICSSISFGQSNEEYKNIIKETLEQPQAKEGFILIIDHATSIFSQDYSDVDPEVFDELKKEISEESMNKLIDILVPIYSKYFTISELKELSNSHEEEMDEEKKALFIKEYEVATDQWVQNIYKKLQKGMEKRGYEIVEME